MNETNTPFRWKLESPEELGSLIDPTFEPDEWLLSRVRYCAARILSFSQNSRLVFVGRSLDSVYDYLNAILADTSWNGRLLRLNISLYGHSIREIEETHPISFQSLRQYFEEIEINPIQIKSNKLPTSFVDVVSEGGTYEQIFTFLSDWSDEIKNDSLAMNKKLRFTGITLQKKSSPHTWRWQQQSEWTKCLRSSNIKNVSMEYGFWDYLANSQSKLTKSFRPKMWQSDEPKSPIHSEETIRAINEAHCLFQTAKTRDERLKFAKELSNRKVLKFDWLRKLSLEIKS
jgi:hypothetical protein